MNTFKGKKEKKHANHSSIKDLPHNIQNTSGNNVQYKKQNSINVISTAVPEATHLGGIFGSIINVTLFPFFALLWSLLLFQFAFRLTPLSSTIALIAMLVLACGSFFVSLICLGHNIFRIINEPNRITKKTHDTHYPSVIIGLAISLNSSLFIAVLMYKIFYSTGLTHASDKYLGNSTITITSLLLYFALVLLCLIVLIVASIETRKAVKNNRAQNNDSSRSNLNIKISIIVASSLALAFTLLGTMIDIVCSTATLQQQYVTGIIATGLALRIIGIIIISGIFIAIGISCIKKYRKKNKHVSSEDEQGVENPPTDSTVIVSKVDDKTTCLRNTPVPSPIPPDSDDVTKFLDQKSLQLGEMQRFVHQSGHQGIQVRAYFATLVTYAPTPLSDEKHTDSKRYTIIGTGLENRTFVTGLSSFKEDVFKGHAYQRNYVSAGGIEKEIDMQIENVTGDDATFMLTESEISQYDSMQRVELFENETRLNFSHNNVVALEWSNVLGFMEISYKGQRYYYAINFENSMLESIDVSAAQGIHESEVRIAADFGESKLQFVTNAIDTRYSITEHNGYIAEIQAPYSAFDFLLNIRRTLLEPEFTNIPEGGISANVREASSLLLPGTGTAKIAT